MKPTIGIVDYGVGNHKSLVNALKNINVRGQVSNDPSILRKSDLLLLPGVGAFKPAIEALRNMQLDQFIFNEVKNKKPIVGICLGMQLLLESSQENGLTEGLGLVEGKVTQFTNNRWHIGWNSVALCRQDGLFLDTDSDDYYFNHSFVMTKVGSAAVLKTQFGQTTFTSAFRLGNIVGIQFHPEKSQQAGRRFLASVIKGLTGV